MSKRAGEFITLDELLDEVGVDAARWFFASRAPHERDRLRHRAGEEAVEREPRLLRPVRPRPDRVDPAQGGRGRAWPPATVVAGHARRRAGGRARPRGRPAARGRRGRGRWPRRRRASRPTRRSSRPRSTPSTAMRGSSIRTSRSGRRRGWRWRGRPRSPWPTRSACWGSPRPSRCSGAAPGGRTRTTVGLAGQPERPASVDRRRRRCRRRPSGSCRPRRAGPAPGRRPR